MRRCAVACLAAGALLVGFVAPASASAPVTAAGDVHAASISRGRVIANGKAWLDNHAITYSSDHPWAKGANGYYYRRDCSGFVSMALSLPPANGGPDTTNIGKYLTRIRYVGLRPGDVLGIIGPNTGGPHGHIMLFVKWDDAKHTRAVVWEHGGGSGSHAYPHRSVYTVPIVDSEGRGTFAPLRRVGITA